MNQRIPFATLDFIDPESHRVREVFAHYGLAMYTAQGFERTLALCLATVYRHEPTRITRREFRRLLESNYQKTLGQLVSKLRQSVAIPGDLEETLTGALEKRNWLTHSYFWERAVTFCKEDGQQTMISELKLAVDFFDRADASVGRALRDWRTKHGITEEIVEAEKKKLLNDTP